MTVKTARPRKPYQSKRQKPKSDPRNTVTPEFMQHEAWRNEADQILAQVDQVVNDIETKWGYGRLKKLTGYELYEKWQSQRDKFNKAFEIGKIVDIRVHGAAMIKAWQALDRAATESGYEPLPPLWLEHKLEDGKIVAIANCDTGSKEAKKNLDGRDVIVYNIQDAAAIIASFWDRETDAIAKAVQEQFPGARITAARRKEPLEDELPF